MPQGFATRLKLTNSPPVAPVDYDLGTPDLRARRQRARRARIGRHVLRVVVWTFLLTATYLVASSS